MVHVTVRKGEPLERALRRFKKKYEKAGILREVRRKSYYLKPSAARRAGKGKSRRY
ncbi:MAG: 30S ribosomal protein S21 [Candidatus Neomarinimicrobiota bacterium]